MSSREEFDAWFEENKHHLLGELKVGIEKARWIWQASRQALVVELPPLIPMPDEKNDDIEEFETEEAIAFTGNGMRAACRFAIEAAGVRVKP